MVLYVVPLIAGQSRGKTPEVGKGSAGVIDDVDVLLLLVEVVDDVGVLLLVGVWELKVEVSPC